MFLIYQILIFLVILLSPLIILIRVFKNKEHNSRFKEKFCLFSQLRGSGKLIWFHGSSVGEILSLLPLVEELEKNKKIKKILITSSTLSSSFVLKRYKYKKIIHQFFPIDFNFFSKKFLNYWKPSMAIFVESEIWPATFSEIKKRKIPLILINARITNKTFKKWMKIKTFANDIFQKIDIAYPQNQETAKYLEKLGVRTIKKIGNLKFCENKQDKNEKIDKDLYSRIKNRKLWCASSTHADEEILCAKVHLKLKKKYKNLLTIIIPRHVNRIGEIIKKLERLKVNIILQSSNKIVNNNTDVYLVDSYGETKKFYKICKTVFLGGSLIKHGGQNPIEPARLSSTIIHGPHIQNFKEVYKLFYQKKISYEVKDINSFTTILDRSFSKSNITNNRYSKIRKIGAIILSNTVIEINNLLKNET